MALYPCTADKSDDIISGSITSLCSYVSSAKSFALAYCSRLVDVTLPNLLSAPSAFLQGCYILEKIDFGKLEQLGSQTFTNCNNLQTLIIRTNQVCSINNINAFSGTPFWSTGSGGTLYVPQALIASYQADTNWATVLAFNANNQISAIEGSPYEN